MPTLFHCTRTEERADSIIANGFSSVDGRPEGFNGSYLSNRPIHKYGQFVIAVEVEMSTADLFYNHEEIDEEVAYRAFMFPDDIINAFPRRRLSQHEVDNLDPFWDEYPLGEPERTYAELNAEEIQDEELA